MNKAISALFVAVASLTGQALWAGPILTLDPPGGAITGLVGATVGWGFSLTNDFDYLVVSSADYITPTPLGVFKDYISPQFGVVGPGEEWTQAFDNGANEGIGSYAISTSVPVGALSTGFILVTYDVYSVSPNDPNFDPGQDTVSNGNTLEAAASVSITGIAPEPSTLALSGAGLVIAAWLGRRRSHRA